MAVKLCIHQAADTIGGNCVEIVSETGHRLILDFGCPLELKSDEQAVIPKSLDLNHDIDGLILSHSHGDHCGLISVLPGSWPIYCSEETARLLPILNLKLVKEALNKKLKTWKRGGFDILKIGPFAIQPRLMDHSAFDAYSLIIEVDGRRIFYTGDFRDHGRKGMLTDRLVRNPPANIDVLLMEGTNLPYDGQNFKEPVTESKLEEDLVKLIKMTPGRVFVTWSATNIDRTVSLYRACLKTGRKLVVDLYAAKIWQEVSNFAPGLLKLDKKSQFQVVVTTNMKRYLERLGYHDPVSEFLGTVRCLGARDLENDSEKRVIIIRKSLAIGTFGNKSVSYLGKVFPVATDAWVWSLWPGYLKYEDPRFLKYMSPCEFYHIHTSGHASPELLKKMARAVRPKLLVPIHGQDWARHQADFDNLVNLKNGEWCGF